VEVIAEAHRSHPSIVHDGARRPSESYPGLEVLAAPFAQALPEPRGSVHELAFGKGDLAAVRQLVANRARVAGLTAERVDDGVLAVNEVVTNSVRHGGGCGTLRIWQEAGSLICEVRDGGRLEDPLAGRQPPAHDGIGGYGLWVANQVCDLVQLRSFADGCAVRVHMRTP
jgi:anti-sigma regulatory factor (Ser/Thr protein kinase)